jgi:hypothetical protein
MCVALDMQHAMRMRLMILPSMACLAVQHFSTLFHKRHDCEQEETEHKMQVLVFFTTFVFNLLAPEFYF